MRASPVALCVLVTMPPLPPRRSEINRFSQFSIIHAVFTSTVAGSAFRAITFGATSAFTFVAAWQLVIILLMIVLMGFRISVSLYSAIRTTWPLTLAKAGLAPAEHTSLNWTHNRTFSFPEYGFPIIFIQRLSQWCFKERWSVIL